MPALFGSIYLAIITLLIAVPLGVGAAIYLEEYRSDSWLARIIQVNINNLAGVPSVMYGILGAYLFVDLIFKPLLGDDNPQLAARNLLGGGMTLALLTLPVIIVSSQEAIRAVPVSLRHAAYALGATRWQTIWTVVLPAALPGTLTGMILALCRALGEAAPLVLFGAILFVTQRPTLFSRFTVMPLQIFDWSNEPTRAWQYNAALASTVLVLALLALNGTAIYLRQRAQRHTKS
jgi:phosphate transport system permease protein